MNSPRALVTALVAASLAAVAVFGLWQSGQGVRRWTAEVAGVPVEVFQPDVASPTPIPAVVVAHGFSGNRQLMYGFGYTLARSGYTAVLIDFAGHGASRDRLPDGSSDAGLRVLSSNLDAALAYARGLPGVDPARVALAGHSMGAGAVVGYSAEHPEVPATVAVSLGGQGAGLADRPDAPRNLLLLVGANEFAGFIDGSTSALTAAYPDGVAGGIYGDFAQGTARRLAIVPGVEHISILFSHDTYREMSAWLDAALRPAERGGAAWPDSRIGWVLLLYVAAAIGFYPLAWALLKGRAGGQPAPAAPVAPLKGWLAVGMSLAGAALAPVALLVVPYQWLPLSAGNYMGAYFLVYGLIVCAGLLAARRGKLLVPGAVRAYAAPMIVLVAYAMVTFGWVGHLTWTSFGLAGDRLWIAPIMAACAFLYFLADEALVWRPSAKARAGLYALTKAILVIGLVLAILLLRAPFFLLLLAPILPALFLWHGVYAHWLARLTGQRWPAAALNAVVFGWVIAATFALVG